MLPICKAFVCLPFYKRLFHIPLQSPWGCITLWAPAHTDLKITTPLSLTCESSDSHRQQTKCAAFILSLQNGKRDACFSFAELLPTCLFKREHPASPSDLLPPPPTCLFRTDSKICGFLFSQKNMLHFLIFWVFAFLQYLQYIRVNAQDFYLCIDPFLKSSTPVANIRPGGTKADD